jgi:thiol-disulfide isomerase/thioredoxin
MFRFTLSCEKLSNENRHENELISMDPIFKTAEKKLVPLTLVFFFLAGLRSVGAEDEITLKVGDPAPKLQPGKWVQGEPVQAFERNKAYLVEFWATWCAPCLANVPHLNEIHESFKNKGLVVIGQNVSEHATETVPGIVKRTKMAYRVALDDTRTNQAGTMQATWMDRAGIPGVPSAFLVDKQGRIAWIGYPGGLKPGVIEEVLSGSFDLGKAAARYQAWLDNRPRFEKLREAIKTGKTTEAQALLVEIEKAMPQEELAGLNFERLTVSLLAKDSERIHELARQVRDDWSSNAPDLNDLASTLANAEGLDERNLALAESIAEQANAAAHGENPTYLATLARLQFLRERKEAAIATQQRAVERAEEKQRPKLEKALESYKQGKLPAAN